VHADETRCAASAPRRQRRGGSDDRIVDVHEVRPLRADGALDGVIAEVLVSVPAISIAGGTDEIQKNIIAERVLGMPRDAADKDNRPFRDVPKNVIG
jgi:hypothetical protein